MQPQALKELDQQRLNLLIGSFGKTEPNLLKYSQLFMLLLDRGIFCHRFTFYKFEDAFNKSMKIKNKKSLDKDTVQGERIVGREQLVFIFQQIAKVLYPADPLCQQRFFNEFLSERVDIEEGQFHSARVPVFDDVNRKLFLQESIAMLASYENELRNVYIAYLIQNYFSLKNSHRLLLTGREITLQNKKWPFTSTILFLKQSQTAPHLSTIDHLEDALRQIVPHINHKQQQFYSKHVIVDVYQKQVESYDGMTHVSDPGLYFHQFQLFIARIAWDTYPRQLEKKSIRQILSRYFSYTFIRSNEDLKNGAPLPALNRKMIAKMKDFYKCEENQKGGYQNRKVSEDKESPLQVLVRRINKQYVNAPDLGIDFGETVKMLEKELPKMPILPKIVPECPPPYNKADAFTIGQQPPPEPVDKQKGAKQEKKSGGNKKDEIPARQFLWEDMPQTKTAAEDHLKSIQNKITFEVQPLSDINRGTIRKQSYPVIIGETLFPGELPKSVVLYLKQASDALNNRNFVLALQSYENGLKVWKKTHVELDSVGELFFQYSKGNVYLSIGKLEYALQAFYGCRRFSDTSKLPFNNPDRSLPYFGLGEVFYEMEEYELAARSFLKARQIREGVLGLEHVQTATVFNNLGCCFFMLGRIHEALGYIQIAEVVFDTELGEHHERTMVSRSNMKKISSGTYDNQPEYRRFWQVFEEDKFEKKKKKKSDDKKKK